MKRSIYFFAITASLTSLAAISALADTTPITAALNAPATVSVGNSAVYWGPIVSQSTLDLRGGASNNYPQKIAGGIIKLSGTGQYCVAGGPPLQGPGPDPIYDWFCNQSPAPPAPQVNFDDYKFIAQQQGNQCGGQPCYNAAASPSLSGVNDPQCTLNGLPKVWFFEGSPTISGSYFCGILVTKGSVKFTGGGIGNVTATPPANAWQQYQVGTPNGSGADGSGVDEYPADGGLHTVRGTYSIAQGGGGFNGDSVAFQGHIFGSTGYTATGHTVIVGSVQFGEGDASSSGGGTIFFQPSTIFSPPPPGTVNMPIILPAGGTFCLGSSPSVTIKDTTAGAIIIYTLDNSDPRTSATAIVTTSDSVTFTLNQTTTVRAIARAPNMTDSAENSKTFTFAGSCTQPPTVTFTADPTLISQGGSSALTWTTQNATAVSIDQGIGSVGLNGSKTVFPTLTTVYTLTAFGPGGKTPAQATVTVDSTPPGDVCGDNQCTGSETCSLCAQDCGVCPPPAQLDFIPNTYGIPEDTGMVSLLVVRSVNTSGTSTVQYASFDGTASAGLDYVGVSGTLTFNPGETSKQIDLPLIDDQLVEGNETVHLTLSNPTNASLGTSQALVTIADNDTNPPPPPTVPFISELVPFSAPVSFASSFPMRVLGSGFVTGSQVLWNGATPLPLVTGTAVTATEIDVMVDPVLWNNTPATYPVIVRNPGPVDSNSSPFYVRAPGNGNPPPFIVTDPSANPNPTYTKTSTLKALGGTLSTGGESVLTYTWMVTGINPSRNVTFTNNGTHAGSTSVATFPGPGTYHVIVRVLDTVTQFAVDSIKLDVTVIRNATNISVVPKQQTIGVNVPLNLTATITDQWGVSMSSAPSWSSTAGSLSSVSGQSTSFSASDASIRQATVTALIFNALNAPLSDSASVTIVVSGAGLGGDLSNAKAFPVPFKGNSGDPGITFTGLAPGTKIRLFTITGRLVKTLDSPTGGDALWDIRNSDSNRVSSGVYLYIIEGAGQKKEGKVVVIQ